MIPKLYQILTNLDCNLRCKYCYEQEKSRGANDMDGIRNFIAASIAESLAESNARDVKIGFEFIGGEAFLHMDVLHAACEHIFAECHRHKIVQAPSLAFSSNGTLFDRSDVRAFVMKYGRYMELGLSIDGTKAVHDANRVDIHGVGSYERAVAGYQWLRQYVCGNRISAKATFNHDTFSLYADGVINLIELGFTRIVANTVFEEVWTQEDSRSLQPQMYRIVDYLLERELVDTVRVMQINPLGANASWLPIGVPATENHCGSCTHMRCLGFDGMVYGCHRFATMDEGVPVGRMTDKGVEAINRNFPQEIARQYELWPEECRACPFGHLCAACSAIPYETDRSDPAAFFARKGQCGFTKARAAAMCYLAARLQARQSQ